MQQILRKWKCRWHIRLKVWARSVAEGFAQAVFYQIRMAHINEHSGTNGIEVLPVHCTVIVKGWQQSRDSHKVKLKTLTLGASCTVLPWICNCPGKEFAVGSRGFLWICSKHFTASQSANTSYGQLTSSQCTSSPILIYVCSLRRIYLQSQLKEYDVKGEWIKQESHKFLFQYKNLDTE